MFKKDGWGYVIASVIGGTLFAVLFVAMFNKLVQHEISPGKQSVITIHYKTNGDPTTYRNIPNYCLGNYRLELKSRRELERDGVKYLGDAEEYSMGALVQEIQVPNDNYQLFTCVPDSYDFIEPVHSN